MEEKYESFDVVMPTGLTNEEMVKELDKAFQRYFMKNRVPHLSNFIFKDFDKVQFTVTLVPMDIELKSDGNNGFEVSVGLPSSLVDLGE